MSHSVLLVVLMVVVVPALSLETSVADNSTETSFEEKFKQIVWKKCSFQITPACLKLIMIQLVDKLAEDTHFQPLPGMLVSSNSSMTLQTSETSRNDQSPQERLDNLLLAKVKGYLKSLTISVRLLDVPSFNTTEIVENVVDRFTGRKKGAGGLAGVGMMLGGAMMTMMMAALAAMAGKALMTSMMALMLAGMGAMKGGNGGGKSTTYEIIAQPEVSHSHTHSSEIQHGHHGWKRSIDEHLAYLPMRG